MLCSTRTRDDGRLLRGTRNVVLNRRIVEERTRHVRIFGLGSALRLAFWDRGVITATQNDGLMLPALGLSHGLQACVRRLCITGGNLSHGLAHHFMTAGGAYGRPRLIAATSALVKIGGRLLVPENLGNEAHVVQRKRILRIELVRLAEVLLCFVLLIVVEC